MRQFQTIFLGAVMALAPAVLAAVAGAQSSSGAATINSPDSFAVTKYVVQGVMKDDNNAPVEGAALRIGRELAYTDSSGHFLVRFAKAGMYPLTLVREAVVRTGVYAVLSAPSEVQADSADRAAEVYIVVRRLPAPQARVYPQ